MGSLLPAKMSEYHAPPSNGANQVDHLHVDEELICLICTELVEQARQVNCCGGLFCATCIEIWMNRQAACSCPQCRTILKNENVVIDVKSERKSAAQRRHCPFHGQHNCEFVGTRQEVADHKLACPSNPDRCTSKKCKTDKATLESLHANEKAKWEAALAAAKDTHAQLERTIQALRKTIDESKTVKQALISAAWFSPEITLQKACGLDEVQLLTTNSNNKYTIEVRKNRDRLSPEDVDIVITNANYNVSMFCFRPNNAVAPAEGFPQLKIRIILISFDVAAVTDFAREMIFTSNLLPGASWGWAVWLTPKEFEKYLKDGQFALGWTISIVP